ncbi:MAG: LysM domain-containing protein [Bacilli bacterium]|nr:LysM domain-containing protein [Bacilli bacterium]MDD4407266.1 LysM domain-containing protein [Bacilli bacterium]
MKMIEEFKVSGEFGNDPIKGKVTTYTNNIKKAAQKGVKTSIISSWKNIKERINTTIYNKELLKKVGTALIVGTITMTSLTGCQINPNASIIEQEEKSYLITIDYTVKPGDNLWNIAGSYSKDIQKEINKICILNNIEIEGPLVEGTILKLEVPNNTNAFNDEIKNIEWDATDYFLTKSFIIPESEIHPENLQFDTNKNQVALLIAQTHIKRESLAQMKTYKDQFSPEQLKDKIYEIDENYDKGIAIVENTTGTVFNLKIAIEDYNNYTKLNESNIKSK